MPTDFNNATWQQVVAWARTEIERARKRNDGALDPVQTATLRGEINAFKKLLDLPNAAARAGDAGSASSPFGGNGPAPGSSNT